jgi:hypothetical protein
VTDAPDAAARFPDPGPEPEGRRSRGRQPRNYLECGERRRLLWRVAPIAAVVLVGLSLAERAWFRRPLPEPPPQIDTALEAVRGPEPTGDAVRLEPDVEFDENGFDESGFGPGRLGAAPSALAQVRDDTFFREADIDAWLQIWLSLREAGVAGLAQAAAPRVSFAELFGQPRSFRGRLVRFKGVLRRLERLRAPPNNYGVDEYWQGWLEPASGPASPIVLQFLDLPAGMPEGMKIHESVDVTGYFFKRYAYNAADTIRVAPLVMTLEPRWMPITRPEGGPVSLSGWAVVTMLAVAGIALGVGRWLAPVARARRGPADDDGVHLAESLSGFEPLTPEESLRRLAEAPADVELRPSSPRPHR